MFLSVTTNKAYDFVSLEQYPEFKNVPPEQLSNVRIIGDHIRWDGLDKDLDVKSNNKFCQSITLFLRKYRHFLLNNANRRHSYPILAA